MIISGFDGQNVAISINAVEFKTLMNVLKASTLEQHTAAAKVMTKAGFPFSPEDVFAHISSALIISRPIFKVVHSEEESGDPEIELQEDDRPVTKPFIM